MPVNDNIMIAMSGGVDSAVAALLAARGRQAAGVSMRLDFKGNTSGVIDSDAQDAARICAMLGIPHCVAELGDAFYAAVVIPFIEAYERGQTPNPCIDCNKRIKFGALLDFARKQGYDRIATGHYARVETHGDRTLLCRAKDEKKDQSYMLYTLSQEVLSRVQFPLGELDKESVRELASNARLPVAHRADSQDICFIADGDYAAFIKRQTGKLYPKGKFLSLDGSVLGEHQGQLHYTVGQRKGLGIALGKPAFVIGKSASENTVTLGENADLFAKRLVAKQINLIPFDRMEHGMRLLAKTRYRQVASLAWVEQTDEDELTVVFEEPQRAISPGQSLVLYRDEYVVGGGKIV